MKRKTMPPRNHVAVALMKRKSGGGAHGKTVKAQRRKESVDLQRRVIQLEEYRTFNPGVASSSLAPPTSNQSAFQECVSIEGASSSGQRHRVLIPAFRGFESYRPRQPGFTDIHEQPGFYWCL